MFGEVWRSRLEIELKNVYVLYGACADFEMKVVLNLSVVQFPHLLNGNDNGLILAESKAVTLHKIVHGRCLVNWSCDVMMVMISMMLIDLENQAEIFNHVFLLLF